MSNLYNQPTTTIYTEKEQPYAQVAPVTTTVPLATTAPVYGGVGYGGVGYGGVGYGGLGHAGMVGPNTYGVPEHYPMRRADPGCKKCHGTAYKKSLLTRKWKPCKHCAKIYGWEHEEIDLEHLPV